MPKSNKLSQHLIERQELLQDAGHVMIPLYPHELDQFLDLLVVAERLADRDNATSGEVVSITGYKYHPGGRV